MQKLIHKFYVLLKELGADDDDHDFVVHRKDLIDYLLKTTHVCERTAINHARASYKDGMIALLYKLDLIKREPKFRYLVPSVREIEKAVLKENEKRVYVKRIRLYEGNPKTDNRWKLYTCITTKDDEIQFDLYYQKYTDKIFNLKVVAQGFVERKANFWIRTTNGKISAEKDASLFKLHYPLLYKRLINYAYEIFIKCN